MYIFVWGKKYIGQSSLTDGIVANEHMWYISFVLKQLRYWIVDYLVWLLLYIFVILGLHQARNEDITLKEVPLITVNDLLVRANS